MSVISGQTSTVATTVPVGKVPQGVAVNPRTNTIYVANSQDSTVSVINGRTNTVVTTVPVDGGVPVGVAVNPRTRMIYVTIDGPPQSR